MKNATSNYASRLPAAFSPETKLDRQPSSAAFNFQSSDAMRLTAGNSFAATGGSTVLTHLMFMKRRLAMLLAMSGLAVCAANVTQAAVTVTAATGGTNLSADNAQNATAPAFTTPHRS